MLRAAGLTFMPCMLSSGLACHDFGARPDWIRASSAHIVRRLVSAIFHRQIECAALLTRLNEPLAYSDQPHGLPHRPSSAEHDMSPYGIVNL